MISYGNAKVGEIPSFSISTQSCDMIPGPALQDCKKRCYARRHVEIYPNVVARYMMNLKLTRDPMFVAFMDQDIKASKKIQKVGVFRWHVAGDFYSQEYLDKANELARLNPNILFYAYTKAFHLDWSHRPMNFLVRISDDKGIWTGDYGKYDGVARVYDKTAACPAGFVPCGAQRVDGMTCAKCRLCASQKGRGCNVGFKRH